MKGFGLSKVKFCEKCNITKYSFDRIMNGKDFPIEHLFKIQDGTGIPVQIMFNHADLNKKKSKPIE